MSNTNQKKASVFVVFIAVSLLISGSALSGQGLTYGSMDNRGIDAKGQKNTLPQLSISWGNSIEHTQFLKTRQVEIPVMFSYIGAGSSSSSSNSGSTINDPNFKFTVSDWPTVRNGDVIIPIFKSDLYSAKPSDVRMQFINVLNPNQARDFQSMVLGSNIISLPFGTNADGQYRHFLVSNDVPSGYYLVNVNVGFDNENVDAVYTGKLFIPSASHKTVVVSGGGSGGGSSSSSSSSS